MGDTMTHKKTTDHVEEAPPQPPSTTKTRVEEKQVQERVGINARVVYESVRREGEDELERNPSALAWSGLAAGLSMGFSLLAEGFLTRYLPDASWRPLIQKLGYSVGFLIVILGRQQLFTENTLTVILPLFLTPTIHMLLKVLRLWVMVLASNLVGTFLFALCVARVPMFDAQIYQALAAVSREAPGSPWVLLVRAIFAGWLIALMVWLLPGANSSRVSIIIIITYLIGLGGFSHIIAGSNKMFFLIATHQETWASFFTRFMLPVLTGNIIGGIMLVAFLGHAQVVAGEEE
jgi:formate/nitrite transporter FocA (FNT family)